MGANPGKTTINHPIIDMKTTIEVTLNRVQIHTEGFGFNTLHRHNMPELWEWHEAVSHCIANHHASAMGQMLPCPEPIASSESASIASTQEPEAQPPQEKREPTQGEWEEAMDQASAAFEEEHEFPNFATENDRMDWIDNKTLQILRDKGLIVD